MHKIKKGVNYAVICKLDVRAQSLFAQGHV